MSWCSVDLGRSKGRGREEGFSDTSILCCSCWGAGGGGRGRCPWSFWMLLLSSLPSHSRSAGSTGVSTGSLNGAFLCGYFLEGNWSSSLPDKHFYLLRDLSGLLTSFGYCFVFFLLIFNDIQKMDFIVTFYIYI